MKIRTDFVTNSSSSSFIICFARIKDWEKATDIIDKYDLTVYDSETINDERNYWGEFGADWAGAILYEAEDVLKNNPDGDFILIKDCLDAEYSEDGDPIYSYDFEKNDIIDQITEANGFTDVEIAEGEGRDG